MSNSHSGKSSLEAHEDEMKVGKLDRWLFGQQGSTPIPIPEAPKPQHDSHVNSESAIYFKKSADASTDAEYQKILHERAGDAPSDPIVVPPGFAPVTFIEADVTLITPIGANLRALCLDNNIPLYTELTKMLNCRGLGLCTTCRVAVDPADGVTPPTAMEKVHLIRDNPKYRLSCQCEITGPVKISTKPAQDYGKVFANFVRNVSLIGVFSVIMVAILLVIGFDVVGKWF